MGAKERTETSRTPCECGKGQFVFYSCEAERWLYLDNPLEKWFEMHIFCGACADRFQKYRPIMFLMGEAQERWKIIIPEPDQVPIH